MTARITAIVCTRNREGYLQHALRSLEAQSLPSDAYEVIVVDNGSTDGTYQVVRDAMNRCRNLRYTCEERVGLSWARNRGVAKAGTPFVAFLDDDARAGPKWLEAILEALEHSEPRPAAVGGRVWLAWDGAPPAWLPKRYWSVYTFLDHGDLPVYLHQTQHIVGANMAFTRQVLIETGGFDVRLGRQGRALLSGEEAALVEQVHRQGLPVLYAPKAEVWHAVDPTRLRRRWLINRMFWDGASQPLLDHGTERPRRFYARHCLADVKALCRLLLDLFVDVVKRDREAVWLHALSLSQRAGRARTDILIALHLVS